MVGQKEVSSSKQKKSQPKKRRTAFAYSNSDQVKNSGINNIYEQCGLGENTC